MPPTRDFVEAFEAPLKVGGIDKATVRDLKVGTMGGKAKPERPISIDEMNEIIAAGWAGEMDDDIEEG